MASDGIIVAAVQLNSGDQVSENLDSCRRWTEAAAEQGARVVVLPENFAYLGRETGKRDVAERVPDPEAPIQKALASMARDFEVTIVAGGMPEHSGDAKRPYNLCVVFGSDGEQGARYRKVHLFDVELPDGQKLLESAATSAGASTVTVADIAGFRVGLSICYDLRFPEMYRRLVDAGAEVLLVPAAFTLQTGKDHWHVLLRARAIESQCWVVAAGQWGQAPGNRSSYGHSMIVDPWGTIVAECSDRPGLALARIDRGYLERVRERLPSLTHRRLG